jgi:hypothetical protein
MATIKKAQLGGLIRKAAKTVIKETPKKANTSIGKSLSQKVKEANFQKNKGKFGMEGENVTLKDFSKKELKKKLGTPVDYTPASKPVVLTAEQKANNARILKEIREGKRKNGGAVKKKMKNGGSLTSLNASNKRDKGIDPKGAYTTVQKRTLAGAKGKAKLTADKQLGATRMAKRGMSISKKK